MALEETTIDIKCADRRWRAAVIEMALLFAVLCMGRLAYAQQSASAPVGDSVRGKQLFYQFGCYGCHGYNGETGARNLVGTGSPIVENVDLFIGFLRLRADVAPGFPSTRMPNYAQSTLSDEAARDLFAYIRTFRLDAPRVEDVPALRAIVESAQRGAPEARR